MRPWLRRSPRCRRMGPTPGHRWCRESADCPRTDARPPCRRHPCLSSWLRLRPVPNRSWSCGSRRGLRLPLGRRSRRRPRCKRRRARGLGRRRHSLRLAFSWLARPDAITAVHRCGMVRVLLLVQKSRER
jgi:hypothetical protein